MIASLTAAESFAQLLRRTGNLSRRAWFRARDVALTSYGDARARKGALVRLIPPDIRLPCSDAHARAVELFLEHRFDLLGSGWVRVFHGMECSGFEGVRFEPAARRSTREAVIDLLPRRARATARRIRALISADYTPIDWQIDFKSGYRWSERTWYRDISYGKPPGADIKVPWELSRLQHLPELAIAYLANGDRRIREEFRNQALDWIAANPPRFGANWTSTMDVGIRIANLLIAYDLFRAAGEEFDDAFIAMLTASTYDHAGHIAQNLEWSEAHRANHYLGDICGLLIAAAYLGRSAQADSWLAFSVQEMETETQRQFLADGGHFEASTSYHRLCAEMLAVAAVFCESVPRTRIESLSARPRLMRYGPGLPASTVGTLRDRHRATGTILSAAFYERLSAAAGFTVHMTKPDGAVVQIGDNDSGRFVRLGDWVIDGTVADARAKYQHLASFHEMPGDAPYVSAPILDHQQWLAWASALFRAPELIAASNIRSRIPRAIAEALLPKERGVPLTAPDAPAASVHAPVAAGLPRGGTVTHRTAATYESNAVNLLDGMTVMAFPSFGTYVMRSTVMHLVIRCGSSMHDGAGAHAHDDHLAIELTVNGITITADPGTFVYTPFPELRNAYRSAAAHACPSVIGPPAEWKPGPFSPPNIRESVCHHWGADGFGGSMMTGGGPVTRRVIVRSNAVEVVDEYTLEPGWLPASSSPLRPAAPLPFSPGYGVRVQ